MKIGILGGGQLARMLALAGYPLGIQTICFDPQPNACAGDVTQVITANFDDKIALEKFLNQVDCVTLETENIPLVTAQFVAEKKPFYPSLAALQFSQDRLFEKNFFREHHIPTTDFIEIDSQKKLEQAAAEFQYAALLKTRQMGYDGKGQWKLNQSETLEETWQALSGQPAILEKFLHFEYEVSLISVRNKKGEIKFYPLILNHHEKGILRYSQAPFHESKLQSTAESYATKVLNALSYIGVLTIEFFYDGEKLIANEMAPRVHNSGHWTIEGAMTSQFENHLRALFDLPLGSTETMGYSFLLNCIGEMIPLSEILPLSGAHYHQYGKSPRAERKVGHVTLVDHNAARYEESKKALLALQHNEVSNR